MCGFAAVVSAESRATPELLARMRDTMIHRGPDDAGLWISPDGKVGFGHRRLSIIDLAHGHQPMVSPDGSVVLVYNGEIYNHEELRRELERHGWRFETRCDTEVLLAAYERFGEECLPRLDGMFAFVLWDERKRSLFFARDRLGKKPLYHAATSDGWIFASEIKGVLEHPDVKRSVDSQALAHYLSFLVAPAPSTLFDGISKLPAGHCGVWSAEGGLSTRRWWAPPTEIVSELSFEEAAERTLELFSAAVEKRMMSDVPFGVYLSGGVDSSANVALMSQVSDEPVRTFSVAFAGEPSLDELAHARRVAGIFGTDHREIIVDDAMVMDSLPALIHHQDEPIADPVCVPLLHLAQLTKESGVTVVQIGEGSDEIFRGYPAYTQVLETARILRRLRHAAGRHAVLAALALARPLVSGVRHEFMMEAIRRGIPPAHGVSGFAERDKRRLLVVSGYQPAHAYLNELVGGGWSDEEISRVTLEHELALRLSELLLMRVDKMTMAASVESRAPYLDHALVEFAAQLPLDYLWREGQGKLVLKHALRDVLPSWVLERRKQGFGAPVWRWMSSLRPIAERELLREPILEHFHAPQLRALLDRPPTVRSGFELWLVLNFALWHRHWIEGDDLQDVAQEARAMVVAA
jgi:asparagine synthase (glutamine-hydrolysing)